MGHERLAHRPPRPKAPAQTPRPKRRPASSCARAALRSRSRPRGCTQCPPGSPPSKCSWARPRIPEHGAPPEPEGRGGGEREAQRRAGAAGGGRVRRQSAGVCRGLFRGNGCAPAIQIKVQAMTPNALPRHAKRGAAFSSNSPGRFVKTLFRPRARPNLTDRLRFRPGPPPNFIFPRVLCENSFSPGRSAEISVSPFL